LLTPPEIGLVRKSGGRSLAAAYLVGKDLSSRQAWIFTGLYVLWQLWTIVVVAIRGAAVFGIAARWSEVSGKELPMLFRVSDVVIPCAVVLLLGALAASLYFMWTTRLGEEAWPLLIGPLL